MASDTSSDSSESAAEAADHAQSLQNVNLENVTQVHLMQMLKVVVRQSSKEFLQMIANKLKDFMRGKSFDNRSGLIVANFCGFIVMSVKIKHDFNIKFIK